jgi:hypothetical protein
MRLLGRLLRRRRRRVMPPLLSARVLVGDDDTFGIRVRHVNEPRDGSELVRFFLHYYAEVLFYCGRGPNASPTTAETLRSVVRRIASALAAEASEPLACASLQALNVKDPSLLQAMREIRATLFREGFSRRQFAAEFVGGVAAGEAATSVLALLRECLRHLCETERADLGKALLNMDQMHGTGYEYTDIDNVTLVPNEAMGLP